MLIWERDMTILAYALAGLAGICFIKGLSLLLDK